MHPGTTHFVVSVEDCLAVGGHFYSAPTLDKTMCSLVQEHFLGHLITNTMHSPCGISLLRCCRMLSVWLPESRPWNPMEFRLAGGMDVHGCRLNKKWHI